MESRKATMVIGIELERAAGTKSSTHSTIRTNIMRRVLRVLSAKAENGRGKSMQANWLKATITPTSECE